MHCLPLSLPALFCCYLNDVALSGILPFCFQQCYGPNLSYQYLIMEGKRRKELNLNVNSWNWRWVARPGAVHHDVYLRKSSASRKTLSSGPAPQQGLVPDNRMEKEILKMKKKTQWRVPAQQKDWAKQSEDLVCAFNELWTFRWGFAWWTTLCLLNCFGWELPSCRGIFCEVHEWLIFATKLQRNCFILSAV